MSRRTLVVRGLQRYLRLSRGLTLGAQGAVIDADNRVLLVRHGYRPGWHFPGGGVEKNETVELALRRELSEEAGVEIDGTPELFGIYANFKFFPCDHVVLYVVRNWQRPVVPKPNAEIAESGFFAADALPEGTTKATRARVLEVLQGGQREPNW